MFGSGTLAVADKAKNRLCKKKRILSITDDHLIGKPHEHRFCFEVISV